MLDRAPPPALLRRLAAERLWLGGRHYNMLNIPAAHWLTYIRRVEQGSAWAGVEVLTVRALCASDVLCWGCMRALGCCGVLGCIG